LREQIDQREARIAALEWHAAALHSSGFRLRAEELTNTTSNPRITELEKELTDLRLTAERLTGTLQDLQTSTSWRITEPLRRTAHALGRGRKLKFLFLS
jgi:hypothetical protein